MPITRDIPYFHCSNCGHGDYTKGLITKHINRTKKCKEKAATIIGGGATLIIKDTPITREITYFHCSICGHGDYTKERITQHIHSSRLCKQGSAITIDGEATVTIKNMEGGRIDPIKSTPGPRPFDEDKFFRGRFPAWNEEGTDARAEYMKTHRNEFIKALNNPNGVDNIVALTNMLWGPLAPPHLRSLVLHRNTVYVLVETQEDARGNLQASSIDTYHSVKDCMHSVVADELFPCIKELCRNTISHNIKELCTAADRMVDVLDARMGTITLQDAIDVTDDFEKMRARVPTLAAKARLLRKGLRDCVFKRIVKE